MISIMLCVHVETVRTREADDFSGRQADGHDVCRLFIKRAIVVIRFLKVAPHCCCCCCDPHRYQTEYTR
jgi:hypothetical protein